MDLSWLNDIDKDIEIFASCGLIDRSERLRFPIVWFTEIEDYEYNIDIERVIDK